MGVNYFTEEQARTLVNLEQRYQVWMAAERTLAALPYDLRRKEVSGRSYLYEIKDRNGNGKSLGPWSKSQEARLAAYRAQKKNAKERRNQSRGQLDETGRLGRALRLPMLANAAGAILREADRRHLLGDQLLVVGTNAVAAYSIEAGGFIREARDARDDFDFAWIAREPQDGERTLWDMLKAVDDTFAINSERTFQARNAKAYEVEVLAAPSRAGTIDKKDQPKPISLPEQEWLLMGTPLDRVTMCRDGSPARIIAPDPRWFALQKLWLGRQAKRSAPERPKDLKQGAALLDAVAEAMPNYPLDKAFEKALPAELKAPFAAWRKAAK